MHTSCGSSFCRHPSQAQAFFIQVIFEWLARLTHRIRTGEPQISSSWADVRPTGCSAITLELCSWLRDLVSHYVECCWYSKHPPVQGQFRADGAGFFMLVTDCQRRCLIELNYRPLSIEKTPPPALVRHLLASIHNHRAPPSQPGRGMYLPVTVGRHAPGHLPRTVLTAPMAFVRVQADGVISQFKDRHECQRRNSSPRV